MKPRRVISTAVVLVVVCTLALGATLAPGHAAQRLDVVGNTYTSPQHGYTVTWDPTWFVLAESSDVFDSIELTNGLAFARFLGIEGFLGNAQLAASVIASGLSSDPSVSNLQNVTTNADGTPASGGDGTRYFTTITYTYTLEDGTSMDFKNYFEARTVVPGLSVVIFDGYGPAEFFEIAMPHWQTLLGGLVIPGAASEAPDAVDLVKGEPAPVYMAGPWRMAIVATAQGAAIPGIELEPKAGKEWVVVVADVTNWGSTNPTFPSEKFSVRMAESSTKSSVASGSTASAGRALDLPTDPNVTIDYGATARVVMVFSVKEGRTAPSLVYGSDGFPLDEILVLDLDAGSLSEPAGPPELQKASLVTTSDGETIKIQHEGESKSRRVTLLGVDASAATDAAVAQILTYVGDQIWIEQEPAVEETATPAVYIWLENERGDRVLLNQLLIESGAATVGVLPPDARFALWLEYTESMAAEQAE